MPLRRCIARPSDLNPIVNSFELNVIKEVRRKAKDAKEQKSERCLQIKKIEENASKKEERVREERTRKPSEEKVTAICNDK